LIAARLLLRWTYIGRPGRLHEFGTQRSLVPALFLARAVQGDRGVRCPSQQTSLAQSPQGAEDSVAGLAGYEGLLPGDSAQPPPRAFCAGRPAACPQYTGKPITHFLILNADPCKECEDLVIELAHSAHVLTTTLRDPAWCGLHLHVVIALRVLPTRKSAPPLRWKLIRLARPSALLVPICKKRRLARYRFSMLNPAATRPGRATHPPLCRTAVALTADAQSRTRSPPPRRH
jgi:hypothetical protein